MKTFLVRPKVYYGSQSLDYLNELKVKKVFLVTDQLMANMGVADKIITRFKGTLCKVFSEIEPVPSLKAVKKGLEYFREEKPDLVLALGGGAPIDVAKAILFFSYELAVEGGGERDKKQPLFIVIPTTSGTGSEVTFYSVITDTKNNVKIPLNDERLLPDAVILDAQLTAAVPPSVTADTGMDALTHAIESYVSVEATELTAIFSEK
ncbi:MAG TPA: iron-containing alcohol dehydrogenase, partial [Chondromyces sp.]|nr:iron-containing alcohol dehydrogenase [Chondromyces sp.]